jgi:hypothetical protein
MPQPEVPQRAERSGGFPTAVPATTPLLHMDPTSLQQIVRAIVSKMSRPISTVGRESVHPLVYWIRCMRDIGCVPFIDDEDAEIVGQCQKRLG